MTRNPQPTPDSSLGDILAGAKPTFGRLGTKRRCPACGATYYDLNRRPPVCSRCGAPHAPQPAGGAPQKTRSEPKPDANDMDKPRPVSREASAQQAEAMDRVGARLRKGQPQV